MNKQKNAGGRMRKNTITLWIMCAIPMLLVFVFSYIPMFGSIIAFKDYRYNKGILGSEWVGFKNFEFLVKSQDFARITRNTLGLNALFIVTTTIAALTLAVLLFNLKKGRTIKIFQTMAITPHFMSWVVAGYMFYAILNPQYGFLNKIIEFFGGEGIDWYSKPNAWPWILMIVNIWKHVGMDSIIYYAALVGIDSTYFEAAKLDGASSWKITWHIILPCLIPLVTTMTILNIGNIFRADFGLFYQITRQSTVLYSTTDVIDTYIFRALRELNDMGMSSAAGLLQSVVGFVLVIITNYVSKKIDKDNGLF